MGCKLPKLRKAEERQSPGNIYSTLRRPQVETKVGVAYTYHFLDFLLGKEEVPVSSVLCLSSVRELPVQVRDLYAQGYVLVAVHPFVHPCGPRHAHIQRQLHRAVLVRETPSSEKSQLRWGRRRLETDVCVAGHQSADPEVIQNYVKKIQDVAEQGVMFVGFLQQPGGGPCFIGHWDPDELSSLHSSPSPIHQQPHSLNTSPADPPLGGEDVENSEPLAPSPPRLAVDWCHGGIPAEAAANQLCDPAGGTAHQNGQCMEEPLNLSNQRSSSPESCLSSPDMNQKCNRKSGPACTNGQSGVKTQNNNDEKSSTQDRMQLFALYNHTDELNHSPRFYSLRVPLQVQREAGLITEVHTHWLDYMTQHFTSGAQLVDGFFHLGDYNDGRVSSVDSVFIFQSSAEEAPGTSYDAIVVEQWTVVDGVVVKTDYVPLLQSLAPYGWRLMCVLPTPIVKTNSDGSLSTKQILFLQRPILQRKRKDFKMLYLKGRGKAKKPAAGTQEELENMSPLMGTEMTRLSRDAGGEEEEAERRESKEDAWHQRRLLSGSRESVEEPEEETDVDEFPLRTSARWTDVCQREGRGGGREALKREERIRQQLFSGVC
ncbi:hypothetical protein fugu_018112 [Takifugu bimaculatus]|uniref:Raftlin, lipid raft linker 1a n=1 Tax=Takifugu bimaculatus TaxID=433685 RepID=A0A4Z2BN77_9TELE|nr:hypothetical protein fugu_018112 [Takifugu bimaculatus]